MNDRMDDALAKLSAAQAQLAEAQRAATILRGELLEYHSSKEWVGPLSRVIRVVAAATGVSVNTLLSQRRGRTAANARMLAYRGCRDFTRASLPQIGRALGGRDHTTVMHGLKRADALIAEDAASAAAYAEIERRLTDA